MNISEAIMANEESWKRINTSLEEMTSLVGEAVRAQLSGPRFDRIISSLENEIRDLKHELAVIRSEIEE